MSMSDFIAELNTKADGRLATLLQSNFEPKDFKESFDIGENAFSGDFGLEEQP